jgi:predicted amidohydrolase
MPGVSSVQITYHESRPGEDHPMPPGGFRIGIVNCWDLNAGIAARRALAACFQGCEIMIPE